MIIGWYAIVSIYPLMLKDYFEKTLMIQTLIKQHCSIRLSNSPVTINVECKMKVNRHFYGTGYRIILFNYFQVDAALD